MFDYSIRGKTQGATDRYPSSLTPTQARKMRSGFDRPVAVNRQPKLEILQRRCQPGRVPRRGVPLRELLPGDGTAQAAGRPIEVLTPGALFQGLRRADCRRATAKRLQRVRSDRPVIRTRDLAAGDGSGADLRRVERGLDRA